VSAKDKGTGKEQKISIQASGGLSDEDIDAMVKDAEANADTDKERRQEVEAKNMAEALVHSAEKSLGEFGDKVSEEDKNEIELAISSLKEVIEEGDVEDIKAKSEVLSTATMKLGQAMYEAQQEDAASEDAADDAARDEEEDVVDAEFEEIDDDDEKKSA